MKQSIAARLKRRFDKFADTLTQKAPKPIDPGVLLNAENPWALIKDGDSLRVSLMSINNTLNPEDKKTLACRIAFNCDDMFALGRLLESDGRPANLTEGSFYFYLRQAYDIAGRIRSLSDPQNSTPHYFFVGNEFNLSSYDDYQALTEALLAQTDLHTVIVRLALKTPEHDINPVLRNMGRLMKLHSQIAPEGAPSFSTSLQNAFNVKSEISRLLIQSGDPKQFFDSPDFSIDLYNQFPEISSALITEDLANQIGLALKAAVEDAKVSPELKSKIIRSLDGLVTDVTDTNNPWILIRTASRPKDASASAQAERVTASSSTGLAAAGLFAPEPGSRRPHRHHRHHGHSDANQRAAESEPAAATAGPGNR